MPLRVGLIGAGLHNLLLSHLLCSARSQHPSSPSSKIEIEIFDRLDSPDTSKFVSCHDSDVPGAWEDALSSLWRWRWPSYRVEFPSPGRSAQVQQATQRTSAKPTWVGQVAIGYRTLDLGGLAQKLQDHAAAGLITLRFGSDIETIPNGFDLIIDTRNQAPPASGSGVQQFMGKVIHLNRPHGIDLPVIMDATVEQQGGFCFVYLLPLSTTEILVEDTRLLGAPQPWTNFEAGLSHYLECKGWTGSILHTSHHESGQIPIPVVRLNQWQTASNGDMADIGPKRQSTSSSGTPLVLRAGAAAGYFHPTTGYSLPCALSSCLAIKEFVTDWSAAMEANRSKLTQECIPLNQLRSRAPAKMKIDQEHEAFWDAALLFNRFLLWGFRSDEAFHAFVYFYRLPLPFIKRFYGGGLRKRDWTTLMTRMPPERFKGISFLRQWLRLWLRLRSTTH